MFNNMHIFQDGGQNESQAAPTAPDLNTPGVRSATSNGHRSTATADDLSLKHAPHRHHNKPVGVYLSFFLSLSHSVISGFKNTIRSD